MSATDQPLIFIAAGEVSGDMHAANLIAALRRQLPAARFVGVGGPRMAEAGCELLEDIVTRSTMLLQAFAKAWQYVGLLRRVRRAMAARRPDVFVPIDSPALNWHFCRAARRAGVPVVHYICPQIWAWGAWRIRKLRKLTDHVACLLPFEPAYLAERGVRGTFVGHPLLDELPAATGPRPQPPADGAWRVLLLPGSRSGEIEHHAAAMAAAAGLIRQSHPRAEFVFAAHDARAAAQIRELAGEAIAVEVGRTRELMRTSHVALAASGTVTLEAAAMGLPMVVFYHVSRWGYRLLRWVVTTRYFCLVNIVAGRQQVRELMPWHGDVKLLADEMLKLLADPAGLDKLSNELRALADPLRMPLGKPAADATAELIVQTLRGRL